MSKLFETRLGKVYAGDDSDEIPVYHPSLMPSIPRKRMLRENAPVPIVLWNKDTWEAALYFGGENLEDSETAIQKIAYLLPPVKGLPDRLKAITSDYPITLKVKWDNEDTAEYVKRSLNLIADIHTKDVNGDGIDEVIVTYDFGDVEVYNRDKRIFKYNPHTRPKLFDYSMKDVGFTALEDHDEIFFAAYRQLYEREEFFTESDKRYYETTRNCWIVRVCPKGITEIHPTFPDHSEPESIETVIGMNRPGSKTVDELVLVCQIKGREGYYLSRHSLDGKALEAPREMYGDCRIHRRAYGIPQSNQIIGFCGDGHTLSFITPDKPVNWIKTITFDDLSKPNQYFTVIGKTTKNNLAVMVIEIAGKLYAIDALGKYHTSMKPTSGGSNEPVAFLTIKPDSSLHKIINITPVDKTMESFLVIQNRDPGKRELSTEQLELAGEKFLSDSEWKECKDELTLKYDELIHERAEDYCKKHKILMPDIHSFEDIKNKIPGYYDYKVKDAQDSYRIALEIRLFNPLEGEASSVDNSDYKNKEEFKKWLRNVFVSPELVFSINHVSDGVISRQKLDDYYFKDMSDGSLSQPSINVRTTGDHGMAFMVLYKRVMDKDFKPAYYAIAW